MSTLTDAERRSITLSWPHTDNGDLACRCGECVRKVESAVETIVAARVKAAKAEALRDAAELITLCTYHVGCVSCRINAEGEAESWLRARADHIEEGR